MHSLVKEQIDNLTARVARGIPIREALPDSVGGAAVSGGVWRFFSENHPRCGVIRWNEEWCAAWGLRKENVFAFGEDALGNQLILSANRDTVYICDHENGSCFDLELGVVDLLESVLAYGLSCIDFYSNGSLEVAQGLVATVDWEQHLHWTQPLILGGEIDASNVSILDRFAHLSGHLELWKQVSGAAPGSEIHLQ
jgi:hypothetical protein